MRNDANGPEGAAFSGMLDLAALDALLPVDVDDPMWGHTRRSLEEIWGGEKINPGKVGARVKAKFIHGRVHGQSPVADR